MITKKNCLGNKLDPKSSIENIKHLKRTIHLTIQKLMFLGTVVVAGNLILDKLDTQVHKNHCDFHG